MKDFHSRLRNKISDYLLAIELCLTLLQESLPILREYSALIPDAKRAAEMNRLLNRLESALDKAEKAS